MSLFCYCCSAGGAKGKKGGVKRATSSAAIHVDDYSAEDGYAPAAGGEEEEEIHYMEGNYPWEDAAGHIIRTLYKHPYIDSTKPTVIADFLTPIMQAPSTDTDIGAEDPLDLTTLAYMLDNHLISDMRYFYKFVVNVFQFAYDFNKPHQVSRLSIFQTISSNGVCGCANIVTGNGVRCDVGATPGSSGSIYALAGAREL